MTDEYIGIVLEEVRDQNKVILEAVGQMQDQMKTFATKDDMKTLERKVDTIQLALTDTNREVVALRLDVNELKLAIH